ncbi:hypothetical protein [Bradyrhizobium sp. SZCCHNR1098]|uniref:hypothetical protein n=1 Tax=Bradyrhizobium sp. SZCCHNR1098 TaxID=3057370 RepID=UPI0029164D22|nr:hypothetical protein [Bradyrhizobium sp. SZCCHNR1098]
MSSEYSIVRSTGGLLGRVKEVVLSIFRYVPEGVLIYDGYIEQHVGRKRTLDAAPEARTDPFDSLAAIRRALEDAGRSIENVEKSAATTPAQKQVEESEIASRTAHTLEGIAACEERLPIEEDVLASIAARSEAVEPPPTRKPKRPVVERHPPILVAAHFRLVFLSVLAVTVLTGATFVALAVFVQSPTPAQLSAIDTTRAITLAGFGAIFGLLGGKSIQ